MITRSKLNNKDYMSFPFSIDEDGADVSSRQQHVREQIEQIIFTNPGERWYRPDFGIGAMALVFEPNHVSLHEVIKKRLLATLADALKGEVVAETLSVDIEGANEKLLIKISYQIAAIQHTENIEFLLNGDE